jgi:hypothetical protein
MNPRELVYYEECAVSCDRLFKTPSVRLPRVFVERLPNFETLRDGETTVLDYFDDFAADESKRQTLLATARYGANLANEFGDEGAIITEPLSHVTERMREYLTTVRTYDPSYAAAMSAEQIIARLGGYSGLPSAFPLLGVLQRMSATRHRN